MSEQSGLTDQEAESRPSEDFAYIHLKVKSQDGSEIFYRIRKYTQMKKLMNAYCCRQTVDLNSVRFLIYGRHIRGEDTPIELGLEDGDEIDAMLQQTGGAFA